MTLLSTLESWAETSTHFKVPNQLDHNIGNGPGATIFVLDNPTSNIFIENMGAEEISVVLGDSPCLSIGGYSALRRHLNQPIQRITIVAPRHAVITITHD